MSGGIVEPYLSNEYTVDLSEFPRKMCYYGCKKWD